jgi:sugar phosphate isomerase/epimerase
MSPRPADRRFPLAYTVCTPDCRVSDPLAYDAPLERAFDELAHHYYDGVELQVRDPAELDVASLRAALAASGLGVSALATGHVRSEDGLSLSHRDPAVRQGAVERLRAVLDVAAELGTMVTAGGVTGGPDRSDPEVRRAAHEALDVVAQHAADVGVKLVVEPQNRFANPGFTTTAEVRALIEESGWTSVAIVADTFHMSIEETSIAGGILRAGPWLGHVQLGDTTRGALGTGTLDLTSVLDVLSAVGYSGWLAMEHAQTGGSPAAALRSRWAADAHAPA